MFIHEYFRIRLCKTKNKLRLNEQDLIELHNYLSNFKKQKSYRQVWHYFCQITFIFTLLIMLNHVRSLTFFLG